VGCYHVFVYIKLLSWGRIDEALLKAVNIQRIFGSGRSAVHALKGINLEVDKKQLIVLRGRSGSGKTTLINILGALDTPSEGQVFFEGENIVKISEKQRVLFRRNKIGYIFQSFALVPLLTAAENVEFALRIAKVPSKEWKSSVSKALEMVGLSSRAQHRPFELSGGEQQRVAIARAIVHKPSLIIADEPTAELDSKMTLQVMKVFRELVEKESISIIMTTHDPNIMDLADKIYELEDGERVGFE
jgi:putative ABC transport system ATP-binding protein